MRGERKFVNYADKEEMKLFKKHLERKSVSADEIKFVFNDDVNAEFGRSKLLILGEQRAGKTSTVRSLMNKPFSKALASTKGLKVTNVSNREWAEGEFNYVTEHLRNALDQDKTAVAKCVVNVEDDLVLVEAIEIGKDDFVAQVVDVKEVNSANTINGEAANVRIDEEEIKRYQKEIVLLAKKEKEDLTGFSIWDFGGLHAFHNMHHMFMTKFGCYLTVFDAQKLLGATTREATLENLKFWLFNKKLHAPDSPVFVVGTHCQGLDSDALQQIDDILIERLLDVASFGEIFNEESCFFAIDNSTGQGVDELRTKIEQLVAGSDYVREKVPISYLRLLDLYAGSTSNYVTRDYKEAGERCGLSKKELKMALSFLNQRGLISYLTEPDELSKVIVLNPQWLLEGITNLIFDPKEQTAPAFSAKFGRKYRKYLETQVIPAEMVRDIWTKANYSEEEQDFFLNVMQKTLLMCKYNFVSKPSYLVPSLLRPSNPKTQLALNDGVSGFDGPFFVIDFSGNYKKEVVLDDGEKYARYLPHGILEKLTCLCVSHSATYNDSLLPMMDGESATFSFGTRATLNMRLARNQQGERTWIKFATKTKTAWSSANYAAQIVTSMVNAIKEDFFSISGEESKLSISLLVPSTEETGGRLTAYETLLDRQKEGLEKEFFPDPQVSTCLRVCDYVNWLGDGQVIGKRE